jgi:DNA (cytosine-5)-methyltransferase 1
VERIDPTRAVPGQKLDLLWASPECTHHSIARGGKPRSDQGRASAWLILKWLSELYVERVIIENVAEFLSWGPLDSRGQPIKSKKGETFNAFVNCLVSMGYHVEWAILCCADYGDPTTRKRLFIQAVKGRKKIIWPQITHSETFRPGCQPWRTAREIIDFTIPSTSIFNRRKPLADATMARIEAGIEKYWGEYAGPFLAILRGTGNVRSLDRPFPAVTTSGAHFGLVYPTPMLLGQQSGAVCRPVDQPAPTVATAGAIGFIQPFITRYHGNHKGKKDSHNRNHDIDSPLPALDTSNRYAVVEPFILPNEGFYRGNQARSIDEPLNTVTSRGAGGVVEPLLVDYHGTSKPYPVGVPIKSLETRDRFGLLEPFVFNIGQTSVKDRARSIHEPLSTVVTKAEHCLVEPVYLDIRFRMLKPHETKQAQGFNADYKIIGNVEEQQKQIGNAVPPGTAKALSEVYMSA